MTYNWPKIRDQLSTDEWLLLGGKTLPYSTAEALRQNRVKAMRGVRVRTRNNRYVNGRRVCDIYLQEGTK